jgi:hypothetical protein
MKRGATDKIRKMIAAIAAIPVAKIMIGILERATPHATPIKKNNPKNMFRRIFSLLSLKFDEQFDRKNILF